MMRVVMMAAASVAALGAGASRAATPAAASSPVVVHPLPKGKGPPPDATVSVPMDDTAIGDFASVWPKAAYEARIHGDVMLSCEVDRHGLAERCEVASETPPGKGFGEAALQLRPTFKLTPAHDASGPIDSWMRIAIEFKPPEPELITLSSPESLGASVANCGGVGKPCPDFFVRGNTLNRRSITMVDNPVWAAAPTFDDLAHAYPARGGGAEGYAVAHCELLRTGALTSCQATKETPENRGFGKAATTLAARAFMVDPATAAARPRDDLWVDVAIRFPAPGAPLDRSVADPRWVAGFDPDEALAVYPPEAAAKGIASGRGVARCLVAPGGTLTACAPQAGDPDGLGFSEAAVKLAATMRINPWTADAAPVDGAMVDVAVRLNLKP
jgi:TonB family protein